MIESFIRTQNNYVKSMKDLKGYLLYKYNYIIGKIHHTFSECKERNDEILKMILLIIHNYNRMGKNAFEFPLIHNYFNNTNYNEVDFLKYANSPIHEGLKKIEEFSIIRQGDKYYQNYPIKEKEVIKFEHKIENMIVAHNKIILSYVDKGSIILYDIESNKQNEIEAHNGRIISITKINDNSFISSSEDKKIKLWNINNNSINCIQILEGHQSSVHQTIKISDNRLCSISENGEIIIWKQNVKTNLFYSHISISIGSIPKTLRLYQFMCLFPLSDNKTVLVYSIKKVLEFLDINEYKMHKEVIQPCVMQNDSFYEEKGRVYFMGYIEVGENMRYLVVVNAKTRQIESLIEDNSFYIFDVPTTIFCAFLSKKENELLLTPNENIVSIDTKTLKITKVYPTIKEYSLYKQFITYTDNLYLSLSYQQNVIRIFTS